ncbi:hypothetical protein N9544_02610 [Flavobacteriales bacterium]|nr:hypothetical protein [Flavobacteriales bacterium]
MITKKNYELYFIDYLEGNLSKEETDMVDVFLLENPELKEELSQFSVIQPLQSNETSTIDFSYLKKEFLIDESNEEDYFIGEIEGDLNEEEQKLLSLYLIDYPEKVSILESFKKTKLTPELLVFPNKRNLKRTRKIGFYYYLTSGVAACILALLYVNINLDSNIEVPLTAQKNEYKIILDKVETSTEQPEQAISIEKQLPIKQNTIPDILIANKQPLKEEIKEIVIIKKEDSNLIEDKIEEENKKEFIAFNPKSNEVIPEPILKETKSVKEYVTEKSISFIKEKTTGEKDDSEGLLAFATKKVTEIPLPNFIDHDIQKTEKQQVRTIKVGNLFSIKRRSKI